MEHALLGRLDLGDVRQRADDAHHLAVGADDRPGLQRVPEIMAVGAAQPELVVDPPGALVQQPVEGQGIAVPVERMQHVEPVGGGPLQLAALETELIFQRLAAADLVVDHVPVEDRFARAGHRQRAALRVAHPVAGAAGAGEGKLHHREADQHDDQHEAADKPRRREVVGQIAERRGAGRHHPDGEQVPGRNQHDRAIGAARRKAQDEEQANARHGRDRDARHACGDRRVEHRERDDRRHQQEPGEREMGVADMPAAQVEIGEQENDQGCGDGRLDAGAPDPLRGVLEPEHLPPEAEVDADIDEHRPGERGGGGKDHRPAHDEHDRQEEREQARDADQDALVEREAGRLVLEGVRLPQIELRQRGGAQLGDIGHGRAGVERQAEHVGLVVVFPLGGLPLARGDRGDARRAEVRPDDPRADEAKMGGDDEAGQLLVGIIGQREHDPRRLGAGLERAHLDASDDAVGARRGGDLNAVALSAVVLDGAGEIDRVGIGRHAHRLDRQRGAAGRKDERDEQDQAQRGGDRAGHARRARPGGAAFRPKTGLDCAQIDDRQVRPPSTAFARRFRGARKGHGRARPRRS